MNTIVITEEYKAEALARARRKAYVANCDEQDARNRKRGTYGVEAYSAAQGRAIRANRQVQRIEAWVVGSTISL
jgi:hypothetical protein